MQRRSIQKSIRMLMKIFNLNEIDVKIKSEFNTFNEMMLDLLTNIFLSNRNMRDRFKNLQKKRKNEHELNKNVNIKKSKHRMNKFSFIKIELKKAKIANKMTTKKSIQKLKNIEQYCRGVGAGVRWERRRKGNKGGGVFRNTVLKITSIRKKNQVQYNDFSDFELQFWYLIFDLCEI